MGMQDAVWYAFIGWLAISALLVVVRFIRRRSRQRDDTDPITEPNTSAPLLQRSPPPSRAEETGSEPAPRGLAELLTGIALPSGLVPIPAAGRAPTARAISLLGRDVDPAAVATALADELERLGFDLVPQGIDQLIGRRGGDTLSLAIDTEPHLAEIDGEIRFEDAIAGDVVIDIWVGVGPCP